MSSLATSAGTSAAAANSPANTSQAHQQMAPMLDMIETLRGGTAAMREAGITYLPQHTNEGGEQYRARLESATLLNVLEDSIDNCVDRIFSEPWRVAETAAADVQAWCEDIDMQGNTLHQFAKLCLDQAMGDGMVHILVDYPSAPLIEGKDGELYRPNLTLAQEQALGMRPYLTMVKAKDLLAAYTKRVNGETIVTHARIRECAVEQDGFSEVEVERVRVLEPGYWAVWEQTDSAENGGWHMVDEGEMRLDGSMLWDRVLLMTLYTGKKLRPFVVKPPFLDLAYLNVRHWQSSSTQSKILDTARFPMLAVSGFEGPLQTPNGSDEDFDGEADEGGMPFTVGPGAVLSTGDAAGKWYYVEPTGNSIKLGAEDLKTLEEQMRIAGIEPLMTQNRSQTATEDATDEAKARAPLEVWARDLARVLDMSLRYAAIWGGVATDGLEVLAHTEVGVGFSTASDISALIQMRTQVDPVSNAPIISGWTFFQEAMRRGFFGPNFDPKIEQQRIQMEMPKAPPPGTEVEPEVEETLQ